MNLILLEPPEVTAGGGARLTGRRARHILEVHRAAAGDALAAGVVGGRMGTAKVRCASAGGQGSEPVVELGELRLDTEPPAPLPIELLLAMPRPKILRKVLQAVASLGVKRLVLVNSARVEKSYFDTPLLGADELRAQLLLGLEQARDTVLPEVRVEKLFKPFVEDRLDALWPDTRRLLAHPVEAPALPAAATNEGGEGGRRRRPVVLAIGPEGGWVPFEVALLEARGFCRISLGPRILRVDVAVPFAVAQVLLAARAG